MTMSSPATTSETPDVQPTSPGPPIPLDVWFDDGNIIVVVGDKRFCVYTGILSAVSSVFRDMFQVSKGSQQDQVDGRPVVHLTGDSPKDISFLLKAVHDIDFFLPPPAQVTFAVTAGILRTSTKYDIPILRSRAILHLSKAYPTSLSKWDPTTGFLGRSMSDHVEAIELARDFDLQWIRPAAMYAYMTLPLSQTYSTLNGGRLSDDDRQICTLAIHQLRFTQIECFKFLMEPEPWRCDRTARCNLAKRKILMNMMRNESSEFLKNIVLKSADICSSCFGSMETLFVQNRLQSWEKLPSIFQCRPWGELDQLRQSICGK